MDLWGKQMKRNRDRSADHRFKMRDSKDVLDSCLMEEPQESMPWAQRETASIKEMVSKRTSLLSSLLLLNHGHWQWQSDKEVTCAAVVWKCVNEVVVGKKCR